MLKNLAEILAKGTFWEKLPLYPQKLLIFCKFVAKWPGMQGHCPAFERIWEIFYKKLLCFILTYKAPNIYSLKVKLDLFPVDNQV